MNWKILFSKQKKTRNAFSRFTTVKYLEKLLPKAKMSIMALPDAIVPNETARIKKLLQILGALL